MTNEDECRRAFEAWARTRHMDLTVAKDGDYAYGQTYTKWLDWQDAWQAARQDSLDGITLADLDLMRRTKTALAYIGTNPGHGPERLVAVETIIEAARAYSTPTAAVRAALEKMEGMDG